MYDKHTEEQEQAAHRPKPETRLPPKSELVLERLLAAHGAWFDVSRDVTVAGRAFARSRSSIPSASNMCS